MTFFFSYVFHRGVYEHRLREGFVNTTFWKIESWEIKPIAPFIIYGFVCGIGIIGVLIFMQKVFFRSDPDFTYSFIHFWGVYLIMYYLSAFRCGISESKKRLEENPTTCESPQP